MKTILLLLSLIALLFLTACGTPEWEITFENKSKSPCDIVISLDSVGTKSIEMKGVAPGKSHSLMAGRTQTTIHSIVVAVGTESFEELTPKVEIPFGKRYRITLGADGKLTTVIEKR